jgi:hypothetical protein
MDYIINRLKESTTWAGIIVLLTGVAHYTLPPDVQASIISVATFLVGAIFVAKKDAKSPDAKVSPQAVANGKAVGNVLTSILLLLAVSIVIGAGVSACQTVPATNPQQAVLQVRVQYTDAVEAASTYGDARYIPLCQAAQTGPTLCANAAIVKQIKIAKDAVKPVIDGAEATVLDPNFDRSKAEALHLKAPPKQKP